MYQSIFCYLRGSRGQLDEAACRWLGAARGHARASGQPGVCITASGPGLTNIATAVATAYADSVPMLVIAPGVPGEGGIRQRMAP